MTMLVHKVLKHVVTPDISKEDLAQAERDSNHLASCLHNFTHGINSDPITLLVIIFSALLHEGISSINLLKKQNKLVKEPRQQNTMWRPPARPVQAVQSPIINVRMDSC
jgi:hypothetical protein